MCGTHVQFRVHIAREKVPGEHVAIFVAHSSYRCGRSCRVELFIKALRSSIKRPLKE